MNRRREFNRVIKRELDVAKFLMNQRRMSYAILSLMSESQRFVVRNLSMRLFKPKKVGQVGLNLHPSSSSDEVGKKFDSVSGLNRVKRVLYGNSQVDRRLKLLQKVRCAHMQKMVINLLPNLTYKRQDATIGNRRVAP